jgi:large subunit ribosomal protein L25
MSTVLIAETGRSTGSANARRTRSTDAIPAVVYGHGMTPLSIQVARRDLRLALSGPAGLNTVVDLTVDGPDGRQVFPAIIKDLQRHPVKRTVQHVDFQQVNLNEEITISVPLRLTGEATEVLKEGGLVDPAVDTIEVKTTPRNIPDEFVVDITNMTMDTVITLGDIPMPAGVTATHEPDLPVVTVLIPSAVLVEEAEGEEGEGAEGEAAEGEGAEGVAAEGAADAAAEGDAPAADTE